MFPFFPLASCIFFHVVPVFLISPQEGENYTFNYMVGVEGGSREGGEQWGRWIPRALSHTALLHLNKKAKTLTGKFKTPNTSMFTGVMFNLSIHLINFVFGSKINSVSAT